MRNVPTFDYMPSILKKRDQIRKAMYKVTGEIRYADKIEALSHAVRQIKSSESLSVKIGILYRTAGHTTPILVEKVVRDDKEEDAGEIFIYNTDSTALDIDAADAIRQDLQELSQFGQVYSLAYEDPTQKIMHSYKRQHDKESCATFSLIDLENMLREDFGKFARHHSIVTEHPNISTLTKLPASFMYVTQSVEGKEEYGERTRKGLKDFVQDEPVEARKPIKIFNTILSLSEVVRDENLYSFLNEILLATSLNGEVGGL